MTATMPNSFTSSKTLFPRIHRPVRNPLTLALFWASKTDPKLASVCSRWARATQAAFGLFVLFTAALAFGSAYYTLSTLGVPDPWPTWIACVWMTFVFFLDREIVGGLDKASAAIRPLLALIIGTIVAVPIEMWVFQDRIDQQLSRQYRENNRDQLEHARTVQKQLEDRRAALQASLSDFRKQEADWGKVMDDELVGRPNVGRTGMSGVGPVFENAKAQQEAVRQRIQEVRRDLDTLEESLPSERNRLETEFRREEVAKITSFVTRYEALQDVLQQSPSLYRLSWAVTLFFVFVEMTPALMKLLTPHVDYHHLVNAEIQENVLRIDEIAFRNYELAKTDPVTPQMSVAEKFALVRFSPVRENQG